jgi:DNA-binding transcriptional ArsR family regulator
VNGIDTPNFTPLWKALADPKRRQIVALLREKPRTTGELCRLFGDVSRFAIMKHLNMLEEVGLISVRREGRERWNILNPVQVDYTRSELWGELATQPQTIQIDLEITFTAARQHVFMALTKEIDAWWPRRLSADSQGTIHLEPYVGGRFYEAFAGNGAGALLATITYIEPDKELRLAGPLDAVEEAIINTIRMTLESQGETTTLRLTHHMYGEVDAGIHERYRERWLNWLNGHLKAFVEQHVRYHAP